MKLFLYIVLLVCTVRSQPLLSDMIVPWMNGDGTLAVTAPDGY